jgi:hypothetical protein
MGMTLRNQFKGFKASLAQKMLEAGFILEGEMHNIVAIKTGDLDRSITTDRVEDHGSFFSVDVGSFGIFYAGIVEFGVGRVYNYHRPPPPGKRRPVVWTGIGQHWAERSLQNKIPDILAKLREANISGSTVF